MAQAIPGDEYRPDDTARTTGWARFIRAMFITFHLLPLLAIFTGVTWQVVVCCAVLYVVRFFGVTAGYHRYFSHKTYKTSRVFQFILAWLAEMSMQRGVLWWASHHRDHHAGSDTDRDIHSPVKRGFWHAHMTWLWAPEASSPRSRVRDLSRYPELRFLDRYWLVPPLVTMIAVTVVFGWSGLLIGFVLSTVLVWHATFSVNSFAHMFGSRRFDTADQSRNNWLIALITLGEGWHNNHHHYMNSVRQGFKWWEYDVTWYVLKVLSWVGVVWDLKNPPKHILSA